MQMENVGQGVGSLPAIRQTGFYIEMFIALEQVIEQQAVNAFRLGVNPDTRIQIGWAAFDDHHQGVGVRLRRARQNKKGQGKKAKEHPKVFHPERRWRRACAPQRVEGVCVFPRWALTHTKSSPRLLDVSLPSPKAHSMAVDSMSGMPAKQRPPLPSLPKESRTHPKTAARVPKATARWPASPATLDCLPHRLTQSAHGIRFPVSSQTCESHL